jgi:hypothetical protein
MAKRWLPVEDGEYGEADTIRVSDNGTMLAIDSAYGIGHRQSGMLPLSDDMRLCALTEVPAQGEALDFPDGPGWWAFEGHWTTAFPERAVIFHCVYDIYLMTDGIWYFQMDNDGHPVGELTGKWYRLHLPWDAPTPPAVPTPKGESNE